MSKLHLTLIVSMLSMIGPFSIDTYLPSFPDIEQDFAISRGLMTQTLGAYLIAFAFSTLIWGAIADWIGRKPVIIISLVSYLLASVACAMATSYEQLLIFRILQGLGIGGALISGRAMVRDFLPTKEAQKVMAHSMMLFAISPAIAPIIGGWLHDAFGWRSVFWFLAIYAGAILIVKESLPKEKRNSIHISKVTRVYINTLKNQHFVRLILINAFGFASFFIFIAGAPTLLMDILHYKPNEFYLLFVPVVSGIMLGAFVSSRLVNHLESRQMINTFLSLMLLIALINVVLSYTIEISPLRSITPLIFYAFSMAAIMPVLGISIINCFPNNRGAASAMQSFVQMGFNGITANVIVAGLGASASNFTLAQLALVSFAFILWQIDKFYSKVQA